MNSLTNASKYIIFLAFFSLSFFSISYAGTIEELEKKIDTLTDEIDEMKFGTGGHKENRVSLHGYGEMHYNNTIDGSNQMDMHRFVIGVHALLTDSIHLNAEIDFEHAAQEMEFEFGYLDFLIDPKFNFRAGAILVPVGFLNEFHEPPLFWSVERPELHSKVIPTTWGAGGVGFFGTLMEGLEYRIYLVNSLQSVKKDGANCGDSPIDAGGGCGLFRASDGIRKGRRQLDHADADDLAVTGRLEYSNLLPGLQLGGSFYTGNTTHDLISEGGRTTVIEGDVKYRWNWFDMNATIANIFISDAAAINTYNTSQGTAAGTVPDNIFGFNFQTGVHLPQLLNLNTDHDFVPFILYENFDTQDSVPAGFTRDSSKDTEVITVGFSYMPASNAALKLDYQAFNYGNNTSANKFNMAVAFMY